MSYDLAVYLPEALDAEVLAALVDASPGLQLEEIVDGSADGPQNRHILRGKKAAYCFTLEGPYLVEPEDVPYEVTAAVLGAGVMYSILVEGSDPGSIPHAVRFTKRLAKEANGAAQDLQTEEVWPKTSNRGAAKPEPRTIVDMVEVRWYHLINEVRDNFPQRYLDLARQYLPEAVPKRFGSYEPHQGNLARDGDQAFVRAFAENERVSTTGTFPVTGAYFSGVYGGNWNQDRPIRQGDVQAVSLTIHRDVLEDPQWRDGFQRFFVAVAAELRSFYATAEVDPGRWEWTGRTLWSLPSPLTLYYQKTAWGRWKGLTAHPTWMAWFSPLYTDLVRPHLQGAVQEYPEGLLHHVGDGPLDREQIMERWPEASQWVPVELTAVPNPNEEDRFAETMPERLTRMLVPPPKPDWT
ncbi:hypothetical protein LN996_01510 [Arthrobacter sp. AK01]|uniref:hypothetical protein n=1 Tax=Micrococcaceae TaxID=1268 RepID=UPI001E5D2047|nr:MULTISPECIES: hypothetical protein [Micrococcaceae]MCD4849481.1 hypothetical protein [Arthrobacter sp. AK01]MCP1410981.1 hypothetical protein [Paenarthrobacter sp. A20]